MSVRIALPEPTSLDTEYNSRALPPYIQCLQSAGATAVVIPLHESQQRVAKLLASVQGVLLPGCRYDIEPQTFGEKRIPECNEADSARAAVDELLLQDSFNLHKPILAICYGVQSLNVWRGGSLLQDLPAAGKTAVNHAPGRHIAEAHPVRLAAGSRLDLLPGAEQRLAQVNSSHHQALSRVGDNLRVTAVSPQDEVIDAVELESPEHFVVGVQWHPERTYTTSEFSRALFGAFVHAAQEWHPRPIQESVVGA